MSSGSGQGLRDPIGPLHAPDHATKDAPDSGTATRWTSVLETYAAVQLPRQSAAAPRTRLLVVEQRLHLLRVDVGLVVPLEPGVDVLLHFLALDRLGGRLYALVADADRILRDRAGLDTAADRVLLLLPGVVADDHDLAFLVELLHRVEHADDRTFVGAEDPFQIRVRLDDGLGEVGRLELVTAAVLDVHYLDVGVLLLDALQEPVAPVDAGAAGLVVDDGGHLAGVADELGHVVRGRAGGGD